MPVLNHPPYRLETARTVIRVWDPRDAGAMKTTIDANLEHLRPWMPWALGEPPSVEERTELLRGFRGKFDLGTDFLYGIFSHDEQQVLGGTGLHEADTPRAFQIGYWLAAEVCGQGIGTEVARALVQAAFLIPDTDRVEIRCHPDNHKSRRIPEKLGFQLESLRRRHYQGFIGEFRDSLVFTLFRDQLGPQHRAPGLRLFDVVGREIPV